MTGHEFDQVLPHHSDSRPHAFYLQSALDYVQLDEKANGPIQTPVNFAYIWGDALGTFERQRPDFPLISPETAITRDEAFEPKGINYRMSSDSLPCLDQAFRRLVF